jgi:hypothetical protein
MGHQWRRPTIVLNGGAASQGTPWIALRGAGRYRQGRSGDHHGRAIKQDEIYLVPMSDHPSMPPSPRRFPAPWSIEDQEACYVVRDHDGQQLAYVYY